MIATRPRLTALVMVCRCSPSRMEYLKIRESATFSPSYRYNILDVDRRILRNANCQLSPNALVQRALLNDVRITAPGSRMRGRAPRDRRFCSQPLSP